MNRTDGRQCAAAVNGGRCVVRGYDAYAVIKRIDPSKSEHDPTRVAYYWTCAEHCDPKTKIHETAEPFSRGAT